DGVDPTRSVQGDAIDVDNILQQVLGDEAEILAQLEERGVSGYATVERDLMEAEDEELEDTDFGGEE
ncbi:MAG: hypothetical protein ACOCSO_03185, partial [Thermoplasmatota archaeon]